MFDGLISRLQGVWWINFRVQIKGMFDGLIYRHQGVWRINFPVQIKGVFDGLISGSRVFEGLISQPNLKVPSLALPLSRKQWEYLTTPMGCLPTVQIAAAEDEASDRVSTGSFLSFCKRSWQWWLLIFTRIVSCDNIYYLSESEFIFFQIFPNS